MEDENIVPSSASLVLDAKEKPQKRRGIIEHPLVTLPSLAFINILSRLPLDDIFINFFLVCKYIRYLILELTGAHPHYFTKIYQENYPGVYFLVTKRLPLQQGGEHIGTYFGELRRAEEKYRTKIFFHNKFEYVFSTTRWTREKLRCRFQDIQMTNQGRFIIVSCNGILCLRKTRHPIIVVTNPIYGDDDDDVFILEPKYFISEIPTPDSYYPKTKKVVKIGSGMGFGCTRNNRNKFKVLIVKNYVDSHVDYNSIKRMMNIGVDSQHCVKATCEIITLGIDQECRVLSDKDCWFLCCHSLTFVTIDGFFFWIGHCSSSRCVCVAFDIEEEKARAIELPPQFKNIDHYFGGLVILRKTLCLYDNITHWGQIVIWKMMKDEAIERSMWSVEFIIDKFTLMPAPSESIPYRNTQFIPITTMPTGEIMMFCRSLRITCIYDPISKKVPFYVGGEPRERGNQAIPYTPNFSSLQNVMKRAIGPKDT